MRASEGSRFELPSRYDIFLALRHFAAQPPVPCGHAFAGLG
jgi:hypothetical protein